MRLSRRLHSILPHRFSNRRRHHGSHQLDRVHDPLVRHRAERHLCEKAIMIEQLVLVQDLVDHFLRAADRQRSAR